MGQAAVAAAASSLYKACTFFFFFVSSAAAAVAVSTFFVCQNKMPKLKLFCDPPGERIEPQPAAGCRQRRQDEARERERSGDIGTLHFPSATAALSDK